MSRFWNENTKRLVPYVPGKQPKSGEKVVKLNTNENPFAPSPKVTKVLRDVDTDVLKLYPSCDADLVKDAVRKVLDLKPSVGIFVGNGSDEVLAMCFKAFFDRKKKVNFADITYSFYQVYCDLFDIKYKLIPLKNDLTQDTEGYIKAKGGVVIANPNAPTSVGMSLDAVEAVLKAHRDDVVIIDEAYVEFGDCAALGLLEAYDNLLIVRTMSKSYSMAGMRIGFALGSPELIEGLYKVKNSFNSYPVDRLADMTGAAALLDTEYHRKTIEYVVNIRDRYAESFRKLGFKVLDSKTNFLFVTKEGLDAKDISEYLQEKGILVRYFNKPRINNYLRISVGREEDMEKLIKVTEAYLNEKS